MKKVAVKDFKIVASGFLGLGEGNMAETLRMVNDWIEQNAIEVINIETLFSANLHNAATNDQEALRVWHYA